MNGTLNENAGEFEGMNRFEARKKVVETLEKKGFLVGKNSHKMVLARCSRSGDILEPLLYAQWYIKTGELAHTSMKMVENESLQILPPSFKDDWFRWLGNIRDWCISRQLWWGHRIPAYRVSLNKDSSEEIWIAAHSVEDAHQIAQSKYNLEKGTYSLHQVYFNFFFFNQRIF